LSACLVDREARFNQIGNRLSRKPINTPTALESALLYSILVPPTLLQIVFERNTRCSSLVPDYDSLLSLSKSNSYSLDKQCGICQALCTSQRNQKSELMEMASTIHLYTSTQRGTTAIFTINCKNQDSNSRPWTLIPCQALCTSQRNQKSELMEKISTIHLYTSTVRCAAAAIYIIRVSTAC
jgi:hypothetical protein